MSPPDLRSRRKPFPPAGRLTDAPGPRPFPWEEVTALALGVLRWPPEMFWRATPRELTAALLGPAGASVQPATSGDLERLIRAFPDGAAPE